MDQTKRPGRESRRPRSHIWRALCRLTGGLYAALGRSAVGRVATAYRRADDALIGRRGRGRRRCRPLSRRRLLVAEAFKNSYVIAFLRGIGRVLGNLPLRFYGLCGLIYGLYGLLSYFLIWILFPAYRPSDLYVTVAAVVPVLSLPMLGSAVSLRASFSHGWFATLVFHRFLGIPRDETPAERKRMPVGLIALAIFAGIALAIGALYISPLILPLAVSGLLVGGMVLSHPEAGVLLTTTALPLLWFAPGLIHPLMLVVLLTWLGYGFRLLSLHRTIQSDLSDMAAGLLLALTLIAGVGGVMTGTGSVLPALALFVCLSVYFLVTHLMTTRIYIKRCLFGVGLTGVLVSLAALLLRAEPTATDWLIGSPGGDLIHDLFCDVRTLALGTDRVERGFLCVMLMPLLCAALARTRRLLGGFMTLICLGLNLHLIATSGSLGIILCAVLVTVLFCLFLDHRSLSVGMVLLPGAVGAVGWYFAWRGPISSHALDALSRSRMVREARFAELWRTVCDRPLGSGAYEMPEGANLFLEVLLTSGWQGLLALVLFMVLLLWKGLSALSATVTRADRALTVGLLGGVVAFLLRGATRGLLGSPSLILTLTLLCALISALSNVLFDESDVRAAESLSSPDGMDRVYR